MFGSAAYVHIPKDERGKLDPKAKKCVLLGYGNVRKGYWVYDHSSRKVFYSRNVKFDEREAAGPPVEEEEPAQQPLILDSGSEAESDNERGIDEEVNDDADPPAAEPPPRRSTRERRPVDYYGLPQAHLTIHREPTTILEDNQSSIAIAKNPQFHGRAKHIDIKHHFIRDQVSIGSIELQYCPTNEMLADVLTKGLAHEKFSILRERAGVVPQESIARTELS